MPNRAIALKIAIQLPYTRSSAPILMRSMCLLLPPACPQLEEPFGILPLENLCDTISRNVYEILEKKKDVKVSIHATSWLQQSITLPLRVKGSTWLAAWHTQWL